MPGVDDILDFWIGPAADDVNAAQARNTLWYRSTPASDDELRTRFGRDLELAEQGRLDAWRSTPEGALALVIVLDQFSRNLYRGRPEAFANDPAALAIAAATVASGGDRTLSWIGRAFLYHPFEHAESMDAQDQSVALFTGLRDDAPPAWREYLQNFLDHAVEHRSVVERFGRFPHRNRTLGRESTAAEQAYLDAGARRYGQ